MPQDAIKPPANCITLSTGAGWVLIALRSLIALLTLPGCPCLLPLCPMQEAFLRGMLQRSQFSAAAAFITTTLRAAGHPPPGVV